METIQISNLANLTDVFSLVISEIATDNELNVKFDPEMMNLHIKLSGDQYHSTITPNIMRAALSIQDAIYDAYLNNANDVGIRKIAKDIRDQLDMEFIINPGSTEILAKFAEQIENLRKIVEGMTGKQKTALIAAIIAVFAIKSLGSTVSDHLIREKEVELKRIEATLVAEHDVRDHEEKMALVQLAMTSIKSVSESRDSTIRLLARESFDKIEIEDVKFDTESLKERVKTERKRSPVERLTIESNYFIRAINLNTPDRVYINVVDESGNQYNEVDVLPGIISEDDYSIIERALNHEAIRMKIIIEKKKDKIIGAILQSIIK